MTVTTALRRTAALLVDLLLPAVPAAVVSLLLWLVLRPDQAEGMEGLGAIVLLMGVAVLVWGVGFVVNDIVVAASRHATVGERLLGFELELPAGPPARWLRLTGRAALRFGLAVVLVSVPGAATETVGEHAGGVAVGIIAGVLVAFAACRIGARGPTTVMERVTGIEVRPGRRVGRPV